MRVLNVIEYFGEVRDLEDDDELLFVSDSQDVLTLKEHFGNPIELRDFDAFFVRVEDGDYSVVYGFYGIVPYLDRPVYRFERQYVD